MKERIRNQQKLALLVMIISYLVIVLLSSIPKNFGIEIEMPNIENPNIETAKQ